MTMDAYVTDEREGLGWRLILGDSCERLAELAAASVDLSVFSPPFASFAGIGSEGVVSIKHGRRFVGIELKASYFATAVQNLTTAEGQLTMTVEAA